MVTKNTEILNKDVFYSDPTTYTLPNDGVTTVGPLPQNQKDKQWAVARYELEHFVCQGSYYDGLSRILESYLTHLDQQSQPAVWVSGFFGSGKSHLVRVLEFLWSDLKFEDGATARTLCSLPTDITASLKELSTEARRSGGIWSAAGKISDGDSDNPRLAVLQVILRSAGISDNLEIARVHLWLAREGILDEMREKLEQKGKIQDIDLPFVSEHFSQALLELKPKFAESPTQAMEFLNRQFITNYQLTDDELTNLMKEVFLLKSRTPGELPLVLLVLDEVQQYLTIGEGSRQLLAFQGIIEACCKKFEGKLLVVATGQEALQANSLLQKLQGRFSLRVQLDVKDVDAVLHETVLQKKESKKKDLEVLLDRVNGEISRHISGTKLAHTMEDDETLVLDYPLLPTRKRFWDRILHTVDTGGMSTQLRTQLRLTYEGSRSTAMYPLGNVIPADLIFSQLNAYLTQNGFLAAEINEMISKENDGTADGELRSRICALIFLIERLDESWGVFATADVISDLLVTDLTTGSDSLRKKVPLLLENLCNDGIISDVGNHIYHIQTKEGKAWDLDYQAALAKYKTNDSEIMFRREKLLKEAIEKKLQGITVVQGKSKTPRYFDLTIFGSERPRIESKVPIWIRHGWDVPEGTVKAEAQAEGNESPLVMLFLPRLHHNEIKNEIAGILAATEILQGKITPTTDEGRQAKSNIEAKCKNHVTKASTYIAEILLNTKLYSGGGSGIDCPDLTKAVHEAVQNSVIRMYPRFGEADAGGWDRVIDKVKADARSPLEAINFSKSTDQHPVCKEILFRLNSGAKTGNELRSIFSSPPYGWPKEAIEGAIVALCASEHLLGTLQGKPVPAKEMGSKNIGRIDYRGETQPPSPEERLALKGLCTPTKIILGNSSDIELAAKLIEQLKIFASQTGGDAPLPEKVNPPYLAELRQFSGNDLIRAIARKHDEINLDIRDWQKTIKKIGERTAEWEQLEKLLEHAEGLPLFESIHEQTDAIMEHRSLLDDPDPILPLLKSVRNNLREALKCGADESNAALQAVTEELRTDTLWKKLKKTHQEELLKKYHLFELSLGKLDTDEAILSQIKKTPLVSFPQFTRNICGCLPDLRAEIAKTLEPTTVTVSLQSGVIVKNEKELDSYLNDVRTRVKEELDKGNPVMLK